jgi:hypothetical protein
MSKYKVILELHLDADSRDELDDAVYEAITDVMRTDIMSACEVSVIVPDASGIDK